MGYIEEIKTSSGIKYKAYYDKFSLNGKRHRGSKTFPIGTEKAFVKNFLAQQELKRIAGTNVVRENNVKITLSEFEPTLWHELSKKKLSPTTLEGYGNILKGKNGLYSYFGSDAYIRQITPLMIEDYLYHVASKHSKKTTKNYLAFTRTLFSVAYKYGFAEKMAFDEVDFPTEFNPTNRHSTRVWSSKELSRAIEIANDEGNIEVLTILGLGGLAGLRKGEMAGLRFENIDFDKKVLWVVENRVSANGDTYVKDPKTESGSRTIDMGETLVKILKAMKRYYNTNKINNRKIFCDSGYVLSQKNGKPYSPDHMSNKFREFILKHPNELEYTRLHALRHTFASTMVMSGVNLKYLQTVLGHSDFKQTIDRYGAHIDDINFKKDQIKKFNDTYADLRIG